VKASLGILGGGRKLFERRKPAGGVKLSGKLKKLGARLISETLALNGSKSRHQAWTKLGRRRSVA